MDFLGATTHLDKEERKRLIESLKYVKVFQEFKEKTQNIIEQIIDKIDNLVRQYKEITTESTGELTAWDTYELQTNRKSLEYNIKEKIANLQSVKIGLMSDSV